MIVIVANKAYCTRNKSVVFIKRLSLYADIHVSDT